MTIRERIIVGLMFLTVVYGAYTLLFASPPQKGLRVTTTGLESLNDFITKIAASTKAGLSKVDSYILQQAEAEWNQDPLLNIELKSKPQEQEKAKQPETPTLELELSYSGYLQMGDTRLAIINGMEYEVGDQVIEGGYIVRSISPRQVVIAVPGEGNSKFVIPLEETE
ncbi:MAG: hypothetical protein JSW39_02770 [Desulfobacterales bacterium]|nr:MAG: hypothetical protein JSW39_02770 [Desulfobacterales bacterium]